LFTFLKSDPVSIFSFSQNWLQRYQTKYRQNAHDFSQKANCMLCSCAHTSFSQVGSAFLEVLATQAENN
jgi:hypothetical protein